MTGGNVTQKLKLNNIGQERNYFIEEINQKDVISKKHKKVFTVLSYIEHLLILAFVVTECVSISSFASLVGIPIGIASSVLVLKNVGIPAGIKKYKSIS